MVGCLVHVHLHEETGFQRVWRSASSEPCRTRADGYHWLQDVHVCPRFQVFPHPGAIEDKVYTFDI